MNKGQYWLTQINPKGKKGAKALEKSLDDVISREGRMASVIVLDTGPGASLEQKVALEFAAFIVGVYPCGGGIKSKESMKYLREHYRSLLLPVENLHLDRESCEKEPNTVAQIENYNAGHSDLYGVLYGKPDSGRKEILDKVSDPLSSVVFAIAEFKNIRSVTVAAFEGGKGKSTVSGLLSWNACMQGYSVLQIDCDTQKTSPYKIAAKYYKPDGSGMIRLF